MHLLPQMSVQQKSESDSFAVLVYRLRDLGIFRNVTASDFGIDFEIEMVVKGQVSGRLVKAQVKSKQVIKPDNNNQVTVGGIAQSTLSYWLSVSKHCPVIVFGVDLDSEDIYYSEPIHHQAAALIDGTPASKSVKLRYKLAKDASGAQPLLHLQMIASEYGAEAQRLMHEEALMQLGYIRNAYKWRKNNQLDRNTELFDVERFPWLLRTGRALLGYGPLIKHCDRESIPVERFYDLGFWEQRCAQVTGLNDGLLRYEGTRKHIPFLARLIVRYMRRRRNEMLTEEACYWLEEDPHFLNMIFEHDLNRGDVRWYPTLYSGAFISFRDAERQEIEERRQLYEQRAKLRADRLAVGSERIPYAPREKVAE